MMLHSLFRVAGVATLFTFIASVSSFAADTVEILNGSKATRAVKSIRKADKALAQGAR